MRKVVKKIAYGSILLTSLYFIVFSFEYYWYRGYIPTNIEITWPVELSSGVGFTEGCGAAIYELSADTQLTIEQKGITFFDKSLIPIKFVYASNHTIEPHPFYSPWKETPIDFNHKGLLGLQCADLEQVAARTLNQNLSIKGSFYTTSSEAVLIVIPQIRWVIFSYFG